MTRTAILTHAACLLLAAAVAAQEAAPPAPRVVVPEPVWDGGVVAKGEKVSHDFVLRNEGGAPLELLEVNPTCGCTVASFDRVIPPGSSGKVHAELDTSSFSGGIAKSIVVLTNDPQNPRLQLTLQIEVRPRVFARPGYARYLYVQGLPAGTVAQTVWAPEFPDFAVVGVRSPYPFLIATFREAAEGERLPEEKGRQWRVEMTLQPDAPVGALSSPLVVLTNHPQQPELTIPVSGFVRPLMATTPPVLDFGSIALAEPRKPVVVFVNFDEVPVEIVKVESSVAGVETGFKVTQPGHRFQISLNLTPQMAKGAVNGVVRIQTTSTKRPVFEMPLKGTVL